MKKDRVKAYFALLATAAIWGIAGPVIKVTLGTLPPFTFLFWRFLLVCIVAVPIYIVYLKKHPIKFSDLLPLSIFGLMSTTINLGLIFLGFERTTALDGTLISAVTPIFIVIVGILFLKEKEEKKEILGLSLVIVGTLITIVQPLLEHKTLAIENSFGNFLILIADLEWAFFVLWTKKTFKKYPPLLVTLHSAIIALITFLPLALLENSFQFPDYHLLITNYNVLLGVSYMAFLSYLLAYFTYEYGMSKIEISEGSVFSYLQPLFAAPFAILWLGEIVTLPFMIGAGFIALGVVLSEWK